MEESSALSLSKALRIMFYNISINSSPQLLLLLIAIFGEIMAEDFL